MLVIIRGPLMGLFYEFGLFNNFYLQLNKWGQSFQSDFTIAYCDTRPHLFILRSRFNSHIVRVQIRFFGEGWICLLHRCSRQKIPQAKHILGYVLPGRTSSPNISRDMFLMLVLICFAYRTTGKRYLRLRFTAGIRLDCHTRVAF